jgi:hypothetical protein
MDATAKTLELLHTLITAQAQMEALRALPAFDARAVAIALTHLETAQLWLANARKEEA